MSAVVGRRAITGVAQGGNSIKLSFVTSYTNTTDRQYRGRVIYWVYIEYRIPILEVGRYCSGLTRSESLVKVTIPENLIEVRRANPLFVTTRALNPIQAKEYSSGRPSVIVFVYRRMSSVWVGTSTFRPVWGRVAGSPTT